MKIFDLLGTMGGTIKAMMIIGFLIAHPVTKLSLKIAIINKIFKFEGEDHSDE